MTHDDRIRRNRIISEAEGYLELGLPLQALEVLSSFGSQIVSDGRGCYLQGEALRELNRYEEAAFALELAKTVLHDDIHVYLGLGWCYKRTRQLSRAIEALEVATEFCPLEAILYYNLACYYAIAEDFDRTLRNLTQALEIDVDYRDLVDGESDFDKIRNHPDFLALVKIFV